jgi:hypothetical protein
MAAGRLAMVLLALVFALSFPVLSSGLDATGVDTTTAAHRVLGAAAAPDEKILIPATESGSELDRSRTSASPAILDEAPSMASRTVVPGGVFRISFCVEAPTQAVILPPSRGPPLVS